jgi:hypothetical protein
VDDARLNADTDRVATRLQASAFNAIGAVYAPRYRQANMTAFSHPTAEGQRALDVAYADVRAAFRRFHEVRGAGRPFLIAAHSQGSMLAYRLLREEVSRTALREALVAAWIIGGAIGEEDVREQLPDIPPCAGPEQVGCIIAWNARAPGYQTGPFEMRVRVREGHPLGTLLCVNPLSGRHDGVAVEAERNRGAVFFDTEPALFLPGFTGAACREGLLEVVPVGQVPRDFMSTLLDRALGPGNYHPVEYQLFFADIRHNARVRLDAWSRSR